MPNGHGGAPRFGAPLLLLLGLGVVLVRRMTFGLTWGWLVPYFLAALLGWRLAFHVHMWDAMEYGGAMTPPAAMARAGRRYLLGTIAYALAAAGVVLVWTRR